MRSVRPPTPFAGNSPDGTYCSFDEERVQALYDILAPIYDEQGTEIADGIDGLFTNEYCADAPGRPAGTVHLMNAAAPAGPTAGPGVAVCSFLATVSVGIGTLVR